MRRLLRSLSLLAALAAALLVASGASPAQALAAAPKKTAVSVTMLDFSFKLSKSVVTRSTVVFKVVNRGRVPHDFLIAGRKTPVFARGGTRTLAVRFTRPGRYFLLCTVPGHVDAGMFGYLTVK